MTAYYNEIDPYAAQWLRGLIAHGLVPAGEVDERSIVDVRPADLRGYAQHHFFAGIGGWGLALRIAGWPDDRPVWTGSCPCQPFSQAARGRQDRRQDASRHLWPYWRRLIAECAPSTVFGEQTAQAGDWFDEVCDDLEAMGYAIGANVLPACAVGHDHARHRLYFVGHSDRDGKSSLRLNGEVARMFRDRGNAGNVVPTHGVSARVAILRAFGNAIVPQVAAEFIAAAADAMNEAKSSGMSVK